MKVRLTRKFATFIDAIDLSRVQPGDVLDLGAREASILVAEGWATPCVRERAAASDRAEAADREPEPRGRRD